MYTSILVFLLCSWKIETLVLKLKDQKLQTAALKQETSSFVGILVFISSWKFVLNWVEHENSFITSGSG